MGRYTLLYKGLKQTQWQKVETENTGGLNYHAVLELSPDEDYFTQVLVESPPAKKARNCKL